MNSSGTAAVRERSAISSIVLFCNISPSARRCGPLQRLANGTQAVAAGAGGPIWVRAWPVLVTEPSPARRAVSVRYPHRQNFFVIPPRSSNRFLDFCRVMETGISSIANSPQGAGGPSRGSHHCPAVGENVSLRRSPLAHAVLLAGAVRPAGSNRAPGRRYLVRL
jgi:hypothetical protein